MPVMNLPVSVERLPEEIVLSVSGNLRKTHSYAGDLIFFLQAVANSDLPGERFLCNPWGGLVDGIGVKTPTSFSLGDYFTDAYSLSISINHDKRMDNVLLERAVVAMTELYNLTAEELLFEGL